MSLNYVACLFSVYFFFFNDTATTEIYTLSLHDALPISVVPESFREEYRRLIRQHVDALAAKFAEHRIEIGRASCRESVDLGGRRVTKKRTRSNHSAQSETPISCLIELTLPASLARS